MSVHLFVRHCVFVFAQEIFFSLGKSLIQFIALKKAKHKSQTYSIALFRYIHKSTYIFFSYLKRNYFVLLRVCASVCPCSNYVNAFLCKRKSKCELILLDQLNGRYHNTIFFRDKHPRMERCCNIIYIYKYNKHM